MARFIYQPEASFEEDDLSLSILEISRKHGIPHTSVCGGNARCSTCRVIILEGSDHLTDPNEKECALAERKGFQRGVRLACQTRARGDVTLRRLVIDECDTALVDTEEQNAIGREENLAVLFSDIRDFTTFSERNLPYDVIHILNRYFQLHGAAVIDNGGVIDKYIGDGLMAIWGLEGGDPEASCLGALRAAKQFVSSLDREFNDYVCRFFGARFKIGIGVNFGPAVVGQIGFPGQRQLTAIGDTVNTASRIESATKEFGVSVLMSESVHRLVSARVTPGATYDAHLKGKEGVERLYEFLGFA